MNSKSFFNALTDALSTFRQKSNFIPLLLSIFLSLGVGIITSLLTMNSMDVYETLAKPPLAPPGWVFPIVWTILYTLMGISAYLIYISQSPDKFSALTTYALQLFLTFVWSIVFFNMNQYLLAFFILILLWISILFMIRSFSKINTVAARLQIPYLIWVTFAGYLNLAIAILSIMER